MKYFSKITNFKRKIHDALSFLESNPKEAIHITKHGEPKAVFISKELWDELNQENSNTGMVKSPDTITKYGKRKKKKERTLYDRAVETIGIHAIEKIDSTALIRKWRDDE